MDNNFANIQGMFKTNTDLVGKALQEVPPDHWFRAPGGRFKSLDVGGRTFGRSSRGGAEIFGR